MGYALISGSDACFHVHTKPNLSDRKSVGEASFHVSFDTHFSKPSLLVENRFGSAPTNHSSRKSINKACFHDFLNTHSPKSSLLIENRVGSVIANLSSRKSIGEARFHVFFTTHLPKPSLSSVTANLLSRKSMGEASFHVCFNTYLPKSSLLVENRIGPVSTKAVMNDTVVTATPAEMSFYELLGISESVSFSEIKQAYKQLALKYHPDVSPPERIEENTRWFIQVQEAYETLSDPNTRALYDRDLARGLHLAFSARKQYQYDEGLESRNEWKNRWQTQLGELKRRSMNKDSMENMSWGARMRRQRNKAE